jgi:hypothetical protein
MAAGSAWLVQVPARLVSAKTVARHTKILLGAIVVWTLIMTAVAVSSSSSASRAKSEVLQLERSLAPTEQPTWVTQAQMVATDYLDAMPTPVPTAQGIPADMGNTAGAIRYTAMELAGTQQLGSAAYGTLRVLDQFLVQTPTQDYILTVPMRAGRDGPVLADIPSLAPAKASSVTGQPLTWAGYPQSSLSAGAQSQLEAWAQAYATNNEAVLYQLTGDPQAHLYYGLGGWQLVSQPVVVSASSNSIGTEALVQVQLVIRRDGHPDQRITVAYDLLMGKISSPLPTIEAWGPAGTGWDLQPYQNANPGAPPVSSP